MNSYHVFYLGMCYMKGSDGLPLDEDQALFLFEKSALQGNFNAQYRLGEYYRKMKSYKIASYW